SEKTTANEVFRSMCAAFKDLRTVERPFLNVVFHFPGSVLKAEHTGLRVGRFSRKEQGLLIQAAVPETIAASNDHSQISGYMLQAIREALALSQPQWAKHRIAFDIEAASLSVKAVAAGFDRVSTT